MRYTLVLPVIFGWLFSTAAFAQVPQCTVPNTLVNGQIADATDVMENFNAVANCVDSARGDTVTHEGTPTTGAIAVFASPTGITSGNLTGDVTTSGATATQLAATGVAPGTYYNATITVDAKGRVTSAASGPLSGGGTGAFTTLLYQPTYTLAAGSFTIVNLSTANEVMVIARNITKNSVSSFAMQFSTDGGATWVTSAVYLVDIATSGTVGFSDTAIFANGGANAARTHFLHMPNLKSATPKMFFGSRAGIFDNVGQITHIRIFATSGAITGGTLTVLGR